jgi:capsular polysaccharide transport system permease protein
MFMWVVALPTALAIAYFGFIASDIYVSESRFVMRSPQKPATTGIGAILQTAGFTRSQDDTYTVHDYMLSRDALRELDEVFSLHQKFGNDEIDRLSRFGGLDGDTSFEALHKYYGRRVTVEPDALSTISTLETSAFTAEDAYAMNEKLLQLSEKLVNQLNERGRQDMIRFAAAEVEAAEARSKAATVAVSAFRSDKAVFDPERQSAIQLQLVSKLQDELIATRTQLAQVRSLTRDNPLIPTLQNRLETLQAAINAETAKVAGSGKSLSNQSAEYERLALESSFADKQLGAALASLEQARNDAQRKQLYLERIVQPSKPDIAVRPRRLRGVLATLVLSLAAWGIVTMLLAGIREHRD